MVAVGTQARLSERTILDWERLFELSPCNPSLLGPRQPGQQGLTPGLGDGREESLPRTSGQTSQRRSGSPAPVETVTLLLTPLAGPQHTWA